MFSLQTSYDFLAEHLVIYRKPHEKMTQTRHFDHLYKK